MKKKISDDILDKRLVLETNYNPIYQTSNTTPNILDLLKIDAEFYMSMFRHVFNILNHNISIGMKPRNYIMRKFGVNKRVADSVVYDVKNRHYMLLGSKKYLLYHWKNRLSSLQYNYEILKNDVNFLKEKSNSFKGKKLDTYKNKKYKLWKYRILINRLTSKINKLEIDIKNGYVKICFGSKNFFKEQFTKYKNNHKQWLNRWRKRRNNAIYYLGEADATCCNNNCQISQIDDTDMYNVKIHRLTNNRNDFINFTVKIKHDLETKYHLLSNILKTKSHPITCRIIFKNNRCYLQITVTMAYHKNEILTYKDNGVIGIDFNNGFLSVGETDHYGNLVDNYDMLRKEYGKGKANKNKSYHELIEICLGIIDKAIKSNKPIAIEDLDFKKTKSSIYKGVNKTEKKYNRILNMLDYKKFKETIQGLAFKKRCQVLLINPYNTSNIAIQKYCYRMKLNRHQGAAFVIARRSQGFTDIYIQNI